MEFSPINMNIVKEVIKNGFIKMKIIMEKQIKNGFSIIDKGIGVVVHCVKEMTAVIFVMTI